MSEQLESALSQLESALAAAPAAEGPQPVGHTPPFSGDTQTLLHCMKEVYARVKAGDFASEALHTHLAQAYGEAAVLAPLKEDGPQPVGGLIPGGGWLALILQLLPIIIGEAQK